MFYIFKIYNFLAGIISDAIEKLFPFRPNLKEVKNLTSEKISSLPKSDNVYGADWIFPLFRYKNRTVKAIIWELKYHGNFVPLEEIGRLLFDEIAEKMSDVIIFDGEAKFLLIPIPISNNRRRERGYNQSEMIAKAVLENDVSRHLLYAPQWFQKIRETPRQSRSHSKVERMKNLAGCFEASPAIDGYYVILIDDVVTTGSTLDEARRTLFESGAKNVWAFTVAH
jgi:ComF family protein